MPRFLVDCNGTERAIDASRLEVDASGALICIGKAAATIAVFAPGLWRWAEVQPPPEGETYGNAPGADAQLP